MLSEAQISEFQNQGYLMLRGFVSEPVREDLLAQLDQWVQESREHEANYGFDTPNGKARFDLEQGHGATNPRLRRVANPADISDVYQRLLFEGDLPEVVTDLIGPNVFFHHCKLNNKFPGAGTRVEYHADHPFDPHTNDDVLAVGIMIDDMTSQNGPVMFVPGSHKGPIFDHCSDGYFCGAVQPDVATEQSKDATTITGTAGSVTFHHCRLLHASKTNNSADERRFLLYEAMSADAWPLAGCHALYDSLESMQERIISGEQPLLPRLRDIPVRLPHPILPNATSIYMQQRHGDNRIYSE